MSRRRSERLARLTAALAEQEQNAAIRITFPPWLRECMSGQAGKILAKTDASRPSGAAADTPCQHDGSIPVDGSPELRRCLACEAMLPAPSISRNHSTKPEAKKGRS